MELNKQVIEELYKNSNMRIFVVIIRIPPQGPYGSQFHITYTVHVIAKSPEEAANNAIPIIRNDVIEDHSDDIRYSDKTTNGYFEFVKESFTAFVQEKDSTIDITLLENAINPFPENESVDHDYQNKVEDLMDSFIHENFDDFLKYNTSCQELTLNKPEHFCTCHY